MGEELNIDFSLSRNFWLMRGSTFSHFHMVLKNWKTIHRRNQVILKKIICK